MRFETGARPSRPWPVPDRRQPHSRQLRLRALYRNSMRRDPTRPRYRGRRRPFAGRSWGIPTCCSPAGLSPRNPMRSGTQRVCLRPISPPVFVVAASQSHRSLFQNRGLEPRCQVHTPPVPTRHVGFGVPEPTKSMGPQGVNYLAPLTHFGLPLPCRKCQRSPPTSMYWTIIC